MEQFPELLKYGSNEYLGNGSYGFVYIIPGYNGRYVLKQHLITNDINNTDSINSNNSINNTKKKTVCDSWIQEYNMHKHIYNTCNHLLTPLAISIVKPHSFSYGSYDGNTLQRLPDEAGASHCYIIMERVYGQKMDNGLLNENIEEKLEKLLKNKGARKVRQLLPFYLYFGALQIDGVITLDLLKGATLHEFSNESLNYCTIENDAYIHCLRMMASFFIIAGADFAPRDIEYVLNGNDGDTLMTILDFNEVKRWGQRKKKYEEIMKRLLKINNKKETQKSNKDYPTYNIHIDLAHIYIDLCGLRKSVFPNPMAPYDSPTPQWKFLPNPITCPGGFFQAVEELKGMLPHETYEFQFEKVIEYIVIYIKKHWLHPQRDCPWEPHMPFFTSASVYASFDMTFQKHIVSNVWKLLHEKEKHLENIMNMPYSDTIGYINGILEGQKKAGFTVEEGWGEMSLFSD